MVVKEIKNLFHRELDTLYGREEVSHFFQLLIAHYLNLDRMVLALDPNITITKQEEQPLFEALQLLKQEYPIQYIIGYTHFYDLKFKVTPSVLIPRPETEELVRKIVEDVKEINRPLRILDIGTGSGCIAVSLAKNLPDAIVFALDISEEALKIAAENALNNEVRLNIIQESILELPDIAMMFDVIVSNPPYVRELEKDTIKNNVKLNEPHIALFVSDEDPLIFYKRILDFSEKNLKKGGLIYVEINQYLGKETRQLFESKFFLEIELQKDFLENYRIIKAVQP